MENDQSWLGSLLVQGKDISLNKKQMSIALWVSSVGNMLVGAAIYKENTQVRKVQCRDWERSIALIVYLRFLRQQCALIERNRIGIEFIVDIRCKKYQSRRSLGNLFRLTWFCESRIEIEANLDAIFSWPGDCFNILVICVRFLTQLLELSYSYRTRRPQDSRDGLRGFCLL